VCKLLTYYNFEKQLAGEPELVLMFNVSMLIWLNASYHSVATSEIKKIIDIDIVLLHKYRNMLRASVW